MQSEAFETLVKIAPFIIEIGSYESFCEIDIAILKSYGYRFYTV